MKTDDAQEEPLTDLREDLIKLDWWREDDDTMGFTTENDYVKRDAVPDGD